MNKAPSPAVIPRKHNFGRSTDPLPELEENLLPFTNSDEAKDKKFHDLVAITDPSESGPKEKKLSHSDNSDKEMLPQVFAPYLPRKEIMDSPYTLVLDLDETLIHFVSAAEEKGAKDKTMGLEGDNDYFYMVRPWCHKFLKELSLHFEIVLFTAGM